MVRPAPARRGFTLVELLVAMALIVFLMGVLSESFVAGLESFRQLKGAADVPEHLREAVIDLRRDVRGANLEANEFVAEGLRTGRMDRAEADELRDRYAWICADAVVVEAGLTDVARRTTDPVARRVILKVLESLRGVRVGAAKAVELLDLINPPPRSPENYP